MDGDGLGAGDRDEVGDAEDVGLVAVGDADGTGDLDGDGEVLLPGDGVPGDVRVSITGTMSAGTTPGKALGDDDLLEGDTDGDVPGDEAGPAAGAARVTATLGWNRAADRCLAAPDRAKLTAADAARTLAATPVATSGRHQRRRDIWSRPGDRAGRDQGRPEAGRPEAGASSGEAGRTAVTWTGSCARYSANAPMAASGSQPVADCAAATSASSSSAVGRSAGSLARQCPTRERSSMGSRSRFGWL